ncbi:molybdopterin molybdotransferase MoeA [Belliella marina]|uniref:Molybdopterin molybdenumtransferase n=1 Tax=Belliella marina TaxID=1644146 RepID=A0ABW4VSS7_9BACT
MISVGEAKAILSKSCPIGPSTSVYLSDSVDLITASDITAPIHVPSFDNSAMDGYAVSWQKEPIPYKVVFTIAAGDVDNVRIKSGTACRIFTGAPIPKGTDTVIPQEFVIKNGDTISFDAGKFAKGANVRTKGSQSIPGDKVLEKGSRITPGTVGLLASLGIAKVDAFSPPSVGVIITGNEIKEVGTALESGQIYNTNGPIISSYLKKMGMRSFEVFHISDDPITLLKSIENITNRYDFTIISGGISVGDYDYVKKSLAEVGVEELFYKVKHKPGKPLFAGIKSGHMIFSLPGNPASVITCFIQYVKPAILQWMGFKDVWQPASYLQLETPFSGKSQLTHFLKSKRNKGKVAILPGQESFNLNAFGQADCLVEIPEESPPLKEGDIVATYEW